MRAWFRAEAAVGGDSQAHGLSFTKRVNHFGDAQHPNIPPDSLFGVPDGAGAGARAGAGVGAGVGAGMGAGAGVAAGADATSGAGAGVAAAGAAAAAAAAGLALVAATSISAFAEQQQEVPINGQNAGCMWRSMRKGVGGLMAHQLQE